MGMGSGDGLGASGRSACSTWARGDTAEGSHFPSLPPPPQPPLSEDSCGGHSDEEGTNAREKGQGKGTARD